jgi:hemerythrin-like metal-binding protein
MELIKWNEEFKTGISSIDDQHLNLIKLINKLHSGLMNGESLEIFGDVLTQIFDYTNYHFQYEEKLFAKINYEHEEEHTMHHQKLVKKVMKFQYRFKSGDITLTMDVIQFLRSWLVEHIQVEDKKYIEVFLKNNID